MRRRMLRAARARPGDGRAGICGKPLGRVAGLPTDDRMPRDEALRNRPEPMSETEANRLMKWREKIEPGAMPGCWGIRTSKEKHELIGDELAAGRLRQGWGSR